MMTETSFVPSFIYVLPLTWRNDAATDHISDTNSSQAVPQNHWSVWSTDNRHYKRTTEQCAALYRSVV